MEDEPTKDEIERRAGEIARRLLTTPWKKHTTKREEDAELRPVEVAHRLLSSPPKPQSAKQSDKREKGE